MDAWRSSGGSERESAGTDAEKMVKEMTGKMFPFITKTWNPLGGHCVHECVYGWCQMIITRNKMEKYQNEPRLTNNSFKVKFSATDFVFVQDMTDLFAPNVPLRPIIKIFDFIHKHPSVKFLLHTKNTSNLKRFVNDGEISKNITIGATVETNYHVFNTPSKYHYYQTVNGVEISKAEVPNMRLLDLDRIRSRIENDILVTVEPILDFKDDFATQIISLKPWVVAIGYDNYHHQLPEPILEKTQILIDELERAGIKVIQKTIRKAWYEN